MPADKMFICFHIKSELEVQLMIANWERGQIFPKLLPIPLQGHDLIPAHTEEEPMTQHVDLNWISFTGFYSLLLLSSKNKSLSKKKLKRHLGVMLKKLPTNQPFWNNGNNCTYFSTVKELKCRCILTQIKLNFPLCTIEAVNWRKTDVGRLWGDESFLARGGLGSSCSNKLIFKTICFVIALNPGLSIS